MSQWSFVIGAYAVTLIGAAGIAVASYLAMKKAER